VPEALFEAGSTNGDYDVATDGRFLIPRSAEVGSSAPLTVVVNWTTALKK